MLTNFLQTFYKALKNLIKTSYDLLSATFREEGIFSEINSTFSRKPLLKLLSQIVFNLSFS
jgi:hypothetical protein